LAGRSGGEVEDREATAVVGAVAVAAAEEDGQCEGGTGSICRYEVRGPSRRQRNESSMCMYESHTIGFEFEVWFGFEVSSKHRRRNTSN
jgi:hypothetical protein